MTSHFLFGGERDATVAAIARPVLKETGELSAAGCVPATEVCDGLDDGPGLFWLVVDGWGGDGGGYTLTYTM